MFLGKSLQSQSVSLTVTWTIVLYCNLTMKMGLQPQKTTGGEGQPDIRLLWGTVDTQSLHITGIWDKLVVDYLSMILPTDPCFIAKENSILKFLFNLGCEGHDH